ncbi:MAG: TolC family protein [Candidatus Gastranaerophilales bacterium]|nr:TolC family protein [Candidatus Gastranaerophilales bacterium]
MLKKVLILFLFFIFLGAAGAKDNAEIDKMEYMNIPFWEHFNDEILIKNLYAVYENNHNLKQAADKVNEAKRLVRISFSNELPHVGFDGYAGYIFNSSDELFGNVVIPDYNEARFLLPLTFNYEVDIWGKNRLKTKSQEKTLEIIKQEEKSVYIALTSAYCGIYYNLIKADKLIECQKELIETQTKLLDSIQKRYEIGTATINDVIASQKSLTYLKEEMENLLEKQELLQNRLSVITSDTSFQRPERKSFDKMNVHIQIPDTIDISLLDKRPDRVKAELNLEKYRINIKIAKRNFLPAFTIAGNLGFNFYNISSAHTFLSDIGILPDWDLFSGGRKLAILKLQKDKYDSAIQDYENTVLKSIQETNDSLYNLKSGQRKYEIANNRLLYDENELKLVNTRENIGMADNVDVLIRKENLLLSKKQEVSLKINEILALIQLYQALGGVDFYNLNETI